MMNAGTKAGLVFILPQCIMVIFATILGFIPVLVANGSPIGIIGCCCAPMGSLLLAGAAGYFTSNWHSGDDINHQGLIGALIFWVVCGLLIAYFANDAILQEALTQAQKMQPETPLEFSSLKAVMGMVVFFMAGIGFIVGLLSLGFSLIGGLIGVNITRSLHRRTA
jgi:hypothetical protein